MMPLEKLQDFTSKIADLPDRPSESMTANELKQYFDGSAEEVRVALNAVIDVLQSTTVGDSGANNIKISSIQDLTGDNVQTLIKSLRDVLKSVTDNASGADFVKSTTIAGLTGDTVRSQLLSLKSLLDNVYTKSQLNAQTGSGVIGNIPIAQGAPSNLQATLVWIKEQIDDMVLGQIPDGSITPVKLSFEPATKQDLESLEMVDTNIDTTGQFEGKKLNQTLSELFQYANDGKTAVANAVTAKGVSASPSDTFATLATKIGQIYVGKKFAEGTLTIPSDGKLVVSGLDFNPQHFIGWLTGVGLRGAVIVGTKTDIMQLPSHNFGYNQSNGVVTSSTVNNITDGHLTFLLTDYTPGSSGIRDSQLIISSISMLLDGGASYTSTYFRDRTLKWRAWG